MPDLHSVLSRNLRAVEDRIQAACRRAGRDRREVTLVAVTKYASAGAARILVELGVTELGESRPQELWAKAAALPQARWHLVGHLQRNKVQRTLPLACLVHSVDSLRLLDALEAEAAKQGRVVDVLCEFNLSGEAAKHGFAPADAAGLPAAWTKLRHVRILGVMTMAALSEDPEQARPAFTALRVLRDRLRREAGGADLQHLSMGMTNDFEVAIEEGATLLRIGSALFQGLEALA